VTTFPLLAVLLPFLAAFAGLLLSRWPRGRTRQADTPQSSGPAAISPAHGTPAEEDSARANRRAAWIAVVPTAVTAVLALWLAWGQGFAFLDGGARSAPVGDTYGAIDTGGVPISLTLQADDLSGLLGVLVTLVALAVQVYSIGYLKDDSRYPSYSAFISLFTSAMLLVVYAGDLLVLYVGWEIMGLCSYLLIGHWWEDRGNSRAAVKAFLVTRLGDVGFLFGIFVLGGAAGSFRIADVLARVPEMSSGTLVAATMLLLAGVAGKSAQVPLHTWLPDAMAGPTPISALIHAATMVAAGIFLVARLFPAFAAARPTLDVLAVLAALGMLGAALAALAQDDLKRVLAYSTVSQLAYMAGGLAAGSDTAAIFHLITHGAFKALLFLCAGVVIHHVGSNLMSRMGGLRRELPITFAATTVGFAALIGLPPFSGFFSKDAVLVWPWRGRSPAASRTPPPCSCTVARSRPWPSPARTPPGPGCAPSSAGRGPWRSPSPSPARRTSSTPARRRRRCWCRSSSSRSRRCCSASRAACTSTHPWRPSASPSRCSARPWCTPRGAATPWPTRPGCSGRCGSRVSRRSTSTACTPPSSSARPWRWPGSSSGRTTRWWTARCAVPAGRRAGCPGCCDWRRTATCSSM
jgi:NADH:ubiquinone oxidoreductase subunit 5 (subunit L)/multisubunit Na+/H+ antiporter MnhA subunit